MRFNREKEIKCSQKSPLLGGTDQLLPPAPTRHLPIPGDVRSLKAGRQPADTYQNPPKGEVHLQYLPLCCCYLLLQGPCLDELASTTKSMRGGIR